MCSNFNHMIFNLFFIFLDIPNVRPGYQNRIGWKQQQGFGDLRQDHGRLQSKTTAEQAANRERQSVAGSDLDESWAKAGGQPIYSLKSKPRFLVAPSSPCLKSLKCDSKHVPAAKCGGICQQLAIGHPGPVDEALSDSPKHAANVVQPADGHDAVVIDTTTQRSRGEGGAQSSGQEYFYIYGSVSEALRSREPQLKPCRWAWVLRVSRASARIRPPRRVWKRTKYQFTKFSELVSKITTSLLRSIWPLPNWGGPRGKVHLQIRNSNRQWKRVLGGQKSHWFKRRKYEKDNWRMLWGLWQLNQPLRNREATAQRKGIWIQRGPWPEGIWWPSKPLYLIEIQREVWLRLQGDGVPFEGCL